MKNKDISYTSISMLHEKFVELHNRNIFVPDWGETFDLNTNDSIDVLLMGRYFERIFQLEYWPSQKFNLFCLSPQIRKILVEVFQFDPEVIGCISRYKLFPIHCSPEKFEISSDTHFYYGGRISGQKNIEFIILTIFHLQILYSSDIKLTLIGNYDNDYHRDLLGCNYSEYEKKIKTLIESLPWLGERPKIITGLNHEDWLKAIPQKGLYISATNLISEDFSVTVAQLQQIGKPLLIPAWGGLQDVIGENVYKYSEHLIGNSHESTSAISIKAKTFSKELININFKNSSKKTIDCILPTIEIDCKYLQTKIILNKKKWGTAINFLEQKNLPAFSASSEGQTILKKCRELMGTPSDA